ncbi:MAG: LamG-like jellyroll fold domain-containing protein [Planctomycetaceae bacterium]
MSDLIFPRSRSPVQSVYARTGDVVGEAGDYSADEIDFTPSTPLTADNVQEAIEQLQAEIEGLGDSDDQTAAEVPYTPTAPHMADNVQLKLDELQDQIDGLGSGYSDDDVIDVLIDLLEDGYRLRWDVETDSVGTHFSPDVVMENDALAYDVEITIDLSRPLGDRHLVTLEGNPTLLVTNYALGTDPERPGKLFRLVPTQDATGGRTINFTGSSQTWIFPDGEPSLCAIPGAADELEFLVTSADPPEFTFVRAIHRARRVDLVAGAGTLGLGNDLTAHWNNDEASGNRIDDVGGLAFVPSGDVTTTTGIVADAASLDVDGVLSCASAPALVMGDIDFSLAIWVRANIWPTDGTAKLLAKGLDYGLYLDSGDLYFRVFNGGNGTANQTLPEDTDWHLIVAVHDAANNLLKLSVDNGAFSTTAWSVGVLTGSSDLVSDVSGATDCQFDLDEVQLWKRALTTSDIADLWNAGAGTTTPYDSSAGPAELNWRRELNYITLEAGSGTYAIEAGDVQPSETIRVAVENDGASGTVDWSTVDWGTEGTPSLPGDGAFDLYELTAIDATRIVGRTLQTGCTP